MYKRQPEPYTLGNRVWAAFTFTFIRYSCMSINVTLSVRLLRCFVCPNITSDNRDYRCVQCCVSILRWSARMLSISVLTCVCVCGRDVNKCPCPYSYLSRVVLVTLLMTAMTVRLQVDIDRWTTQLAVPWTPTIYTAAGSVAVPRPGNGFSTWCVRVAPAAQ